MVVFVGFACEIAAPVRSKGTNYGCEKHGFSHSPHYFVIPLYVSWTR